MIAGHNLQDRALFVIETPYEGRMRRIDLRIPSTADLIHLVFEPDMMTESIQMAVLETELMHLVAEIDGSPMTSQMAHGIVRDSEALGVVLAARNSLYEILSERGRIHALCPACRAWEATLSPVALAASLHAGPWPIVEKRLFLAVPSLTSLWPSGSRPSDLPTTPRLRFELPSRVAGLLSEGASGVLGDLDLDTGLYREAAAWKKWAPANEAPQPHGREAWNYESPGFRAVLRLTVALEKLGDLEELSPDIVEDLPVVDFFFLDNLYFLTHNVSTSDANLPRVRCDRCQVVFLPLK